MLYDPLKALPAKQKCLVAYLDRVLRTIERGWCKDEPYKSYRGQDQYCIVGAIDRMVPTRRRAQVYETLAKHLPREWRSIEPSRRQLMRFNDDPHTRRQNVTALIELAKEAVLYRITIPTNKIIQSK